MLLVLSSYYYRKINKEHKAENDKNKQIVIFGKTGHAEVLGLVGQTGEAIVIENIEETKKLDFSKDIYLYSQTTKSLEEFKNL